MKKLGHGLGLEFRQKGAEIERTLNRIGRAIAGSTKGSGKRLGELRDTLVARYRQRARPSRLVFFAEARVRVKKRVTPAPGVVGKEGRPAAPPKEIRSAFLSQRTLERRRLRLLWKLEMDGSGVRQADVDGDHLYVVTGKNRMYSIELTSGLTRWIRDLGGRPDGPPGFNVNYVVISAGDTVHVIDKQTGKYRWRFETNVQPASRPYCSAGYFAFGCWTGEVCGFKFGERHPRWRFKAGGRVFAGPFFRGGFAFAASDDGTLTKYNISMRLISKETQLGGRPVGDLRGVKDLMYIGTENFDMSAVRRGSLVKVWTHGCGGRVVGGPWLSANREVLYYSAYDDGLYALTAMSGKARWKVDRGLKPVARSADHLFVLRDDGVICKVDAGTGKVLWSESIAPFVTAVAHIKSDTMCLISKDGQIFAVAPQK